MEKIYDPKIIEPEIYKLWEKSQFFNPDKLPFLKEEIDKDSNNFTFCIMMPPPNITGSLHMGHALNNTIQDILIRFKRMQGFKTLWLPGIDHAGIATQNVVEKELKKEGKTRFELGRDEFVKRVWEWYEKYGKIILDQLKKLGASCDWSRTRFTMDDDYVKAVQAAFIHYYKKGLIYRGERVVNWCPRCATSLSDLELEYKEEKGSLWYLKYPLKENPNKFITVATTRPETMLGDEAVAVNPNDIRYKNYIGKKAILPLQNKEIPIIADNLVEPEFGTGAVKVTPAHDFIDYEISLRHNLPLTKIIDEEGKMKEEAGQDFIGLSVLEARKKVIAELEKLSLVEKVEDYTHNVSRCYRCGTAIEPLPNLQWFVKMKDLAKLAIEEVEKGGIVFIPKKWEKLYFDWLQNIKDWCISRQIWWGHRLPVFFCGNKKGEKNFIVVEEKPNKCPICNNCEMIQSEDVLDTWFSSALWPFATLGWPKKTKDLETFYPTNVLSTARDIINLWVARMIYSGLEFMGKKPFNQVYVHATVLTREGKRMSKSLGTGVDPLELIEKYGADATRFGLIYQSMGGQDLHFAEEHLVAGKKFCNKIWNASRFILSNMTDITELINLKKLSKILKTNKSLTKSDEKILLQVQELKKNVAKKIENFEFGQALHDIYDFFWHDFCDIYIEKSKQQMKDEKLKESTQKVLLFVLFNSLKVLHPFMPFLTEKIYQIFPIEDKLFLMVEKWD